MTTEHVQADLSVQPTLGGVTLYGKGSIIPATCCVPLHPRGVNNIYVHQYFMIFLSPCGTPFSNAQFKG